MGLTRPCVTRVTSPLPYVNSINIARRHGLSVQVIERFTEDVCRACEALQPDILLSCFQPLILSKRLLTLPKLAALNVHPSLLPKYGGIDPVFWALRNGERLMGITVHHIIPKVDAGDIVTQRVVDIPFDYTYEDVDDVLTKTAAELISELVNLAGEGSLPHLPQDLSKRSYYSRPREGDTTITCDQDSQTVQNIMRACYPYRIPIALINGRKVRLWKARVDNASVFLDRAPGQLGSTPDGFLTVQVRGGGQLVIEIASFGLWSILPARLLFAISGIGKHSRQ